jgi:hypothetical protein
MNVEKYVIPEVMCDADWFTLTGQNIGPVKDKDWKNGRVTTTIMPVRPNQLLVRGCSQIGKNQ